MARDWYVRQGGVVYGPYSSDKVRHLAREGRIAPDTEVAYSPTGPWHLALRVRGLAFPGDPPLASSAGVTPQPPTATVTPHGFAGAAESELARAHRMPLVDTSYGDSGRERDLWSGRPSQLTNLRTFILCGLFCWLIYPVVRAIWKWLVTHSTRYTLTTQRFRVTRGVFTTDVQELELYRVKDTSFSQTAFEWLFGLAAVRIASSDHSTPLTAIESVPAKNARWIREAIRARVEDLRMRKSVREVDYAAEP